MRGPILAALVLAASASLSALKADEPASPALKADLEKLQGRWKLTSMKIAGKEMETHDSRFVIEFRGNEQTVLLGEVRRRSVLVTLASGNPFSHMDLSSTERPDKPSVIQGIYKLEGDRFTFARPGPKGQRPKDFVTSEDSQVMVAVYDKVRAVEPVDRPRAESFLRDPKAPKLNLVGLQDHVGTQLAAAKRIRPSAPLLMLLSALPAYRIATAFAVATPDEPTSIMKVVLPVEGENTVIFVAPDGQSVAKGALICELDSAPLRDRLTDQEIATTKGAADLDNALKTLEVAKIGKQTVVATHASKVAMARLGVRVAENGLTMARANLDAAHETGLKERGVRDYRIALLKAEDVADDARNRLEILERFTGPKQMTEADVAIQRANSAVLSHEARFKVSKANELGLRKNITNCRILSPVSGTLRLAREGGEGGKFAIQEGIKAIGGRVYFQVEPKPDR